MKTLFSTLMLVGPIAGVIIPGFLAAGISMPTAFVVGAVALLVAVVTYVHRTTASVDQVRTGSPFATNYKVTQLPPVALLPRPAAQTIQKRRRVRAIVEIAA
jgi:hypothetical protein